LLCNCLHPPITSCLLGTNIPLIISYSVTNPCNTLTPLHAAWQKTKHSLTNLTQFGTDGGRGGGWYRWSLAPETRSPKAAVNSRLFPPKWTNIFQDLTLNTTRVSKLWAPREETAPSYNWRSLWTRW
jgi:hypothetical protein